jgi:hypothetical protein
MGIKGNGAPFCCTSLAVHRWLFYKCITTFASVYRKGLGDGPFFLARLFNRSSKHGRITRGFVTKHEASLSSIYRIGCTVCWWKSVYRSSTNTGVSLKGVCACLYTGEAGDDFEAMLLDSTLSSHGTLIHTLPHFLKYHHASLDSV